MFVVCCSGLGVGGLLFGLVVLVVSLLVFTLSRPTVHIATKGYTKTHNQSLTVESCFSHNLLGLRFIFENQSL